MAFNVLHCNALSVSVTIKIIKIGGIIMKNTFLVRLKREEIGLIIHALSHQRDMFGDLIKIDPSANTDDIKDMYNQLKKLHDKLLLFTN